MVKEHWNTFIKQDNHNVEKFGLSIQKNLQKQFRIYYQFSQSITENIFGTSTNEPFLPFITIFLQNFAVYPLVYIQK